MSDKRLSVDERLAGYQKMRDSMVNLPDPSAQTVARLPRDAVPVDAYIVYRTKRGDGGKTWAYAQGMTHYICAKTEEALLELMSSGVELQRITRFTQQGTGHTGLSVDGVPVWWSRVEHEGYVMQVRFEWEAGKRPAGRIG
jgi:hypothetical protein